MKERILNLMEKELKDTDLRISMAIEKAIKEIPEENIPRTLNFIFYETINALKYLDESDKLYDFYIKLLTLSLQPGGQNKIHPSFIGILKTLNIDEMTILTNIFNNNYEFISTYDFEIGRGFFNYNRVKFDYPKDTLLFPLNFDFYIHHLMDALKLIRWPIYRQEAIREMGVQTGETQYSRLVITVSGEKFISCFI